ncbi:MAG: amidohydrolase [Bryobacteraceae bacterium]|nr:amidohydrolase [Bryobacteraceae bacterium]
MHRSLLLLAAVALLPAAGPDLILHSGKIVTVDARFRLAEAVAITQGRIAAVGSTKAVLAAKTPQTQLIDLKGKTVLPGLIDAHVHVLGAGLSEFRKPLPPFDSIAAIQKWVREQARTTPKGEWIVVPRTLPPRLAEMRMPTRQDLDVAPGHPVAFDGSYVWAANTMALRVSGIDRTTPNPPGGEVVKDANGEPNGILRNASHLLKGAHRAETFTDEERLAAIEKTLSLYAAAGLTAVGDRAVTAGEVALYQRLKQQQRLPVRVVLTWRPDASRPVEQIVAEIQSRPWTTNQGDERLKFGTFKVTLDGGQSVGTAYQRRPYGPFGRQLYGQTDPAARGTLFVDPDKLYRIFSAARDKGWQLTAHVQGGAAIDVLLDAFERLDREKPIAPLRHHVMHGSYMSEEAVKKMKRLGVAADAQPGWLYFDVPALSRVFGLENMRWFFPVSSWLKEGIQVAGGSDHMIGHDKNNAVNPYNPFLNMWMTITRRTREGKVIYPQERIDRIQALRMYTTAPAWLQFSEKERGSIEPGKLADLVVIDRDFLACPEDEIKSIEPLLTVVEGKVVYQAPNTR